MKKTISVLLIATILLCSFSSFSAAEEQQPLTEQVEEPEAVKLSDNASDFVLLSEAVPDAILEIRYYSTYNFVGDRIDGY